MADKREPFGGTLSLEIESKEEGNAELDFLLSKIREIKSILELFPYMDMTILYDLTSKEEKKETVQDLLDLLKKVEDEIKTKFESGELVSQDDVDKYLKLLNFLEVDFWSLMSEKISQKAGFSYKAVLEWPEEYLDRDFLSQKTKVFDTFVKSVLTSAEYSYEAVLSWPEEYLDKTLKGESETVFARLVREVLTSIEYSYEAVLSWPKEYLDKTLDGDNETIFARLVKEVRILAEYSYKALMNWKEEYLLRTLEGCNGNVVSILTAAVSDPEIESSSLYSSQMILGWSDIYKKSPYNYTPEDYARFFNQVLTNPKLVVDIFEENFSYFSVSELESLLKSVVSSQKAIYYALTTWDSSTLDKKIGKDGKDIFFVLASNLDFNHVDNLNLNSLCLLSEDKYLDRVLDGKNTFFTKSILAIRDSTNLFIYLPAYFSKDYLSRSMPDTDKTIFDLVVEKALKIPYFAYVAALNWQKEFLDIVQEGENESILSRLLDVVKKDSEYSQLLLVTYSEDSSTLDSHFVDLVEKVLESPEFSYEALLTWPEDHLNKIISGSAETVFSRLYEKALLFVEEKKENKYKLFLFLTKKQSESSSIKDITQFLASLRESLIKDESFYFWIIGKLYQKDKDVLKLLEDLEIFEKLIESVSNDPKDSGILLTSLPDYLLDKTVGDKEDNTFSKLVRKSFDAENYTIVHTLLNLDYSYLNRCLPGDAEKIFYKYIRLVINDPNSAHSLLLFLSDNLLFDTLPGDDMSIFFRLVETVSTSPKSSLDSIKEISEAKLYRKFPGTGKRVIEMFVDSVLQDHRWVSDLILHCEILFLEYIIPDDNKSVLKKLVSVLSDDEIVRLKNLFLSNNRKLRRKDLFLEAIK
ncbi:MAG: hypothetical protein WC070_03560 [Candidatus Magasanikbacteria bacterium]